MLTCRKRHAVSLCHLLSGTSLLLGDPRGSLALGPSALAPGTQLLPCRNCTGSKRSMGPETPTSGSSAAGAGLGWHQSSFSFPPSPNRQSVRASPGFEAALSLASAHPSVQAGVFRRERREDDGRILSPQVTAEQSRRRTLTDGCARLVSAGNPVLQRPRHPLCTLGTKRFPQKRYWHAALKSTTDAFLPRHGRLRICLQQLRSLLGRGFHPHPAQWVQGSAVAAAAAPMHSGAGNFHCRHKCMFYPL